MTRKAHKSNNTHEPHTDIHMHTQHVYPQPTHPNAASSLASLTPPLTPSPRPRVASSARCGIRTPSQELPRQPLVNCINTPTFSVCEISCLPPSILWGSNKLMLGQQVPWMYSYRICSWERCDISLSFSGWLEKLGSWHLIIALRSPWYQEG